MYGVAGAHQSTHRSKVLPDHSDSEGRPGILQAALFGLCPKCDAKTIFAGLINFSVKCDNCDLDYSAFNVGDGPAALLSLVIGALIIILAIMLDIAAHPPFWVHAVIWIPVTTMTILLSLRTAKGVLLILEHRNRAVEAVRNDMGT